MRLEHATKGMLAALILIGSTPTAGTEQPAATWEKVVFHIDDVANARWAMLLANSYLDDSPQAKVVIVTYGPGIDFLMDYAEDIRGNPFDPAVTRLVERGVEFRVCAATLSARGIARDDMTDAAVIVPSGISEIARLQLKEGYAYLKP